MPIEVKMKLKKLLYLVLFASIVVPVVITIIVFATSMTSFLTNKVEQEDLPTALREIKNAVELDLLKTIAPSRTLANSEYLKDWLARGEPQTGTTLLTRHLNTLKTENGGMSAYVVSTQTGNYYTANGVSRVISKRSDPWFYAFINSAVEMEVAIDVDKQTNIASAFINYVITINGERVGLAGIGQSLNNMSALISSYKIGRNGIVYLTDSNGVIKLHPNPGRHGEKIPLAEITTGNVREINRDNGRITQLASKLETVDWYVVTEVPSAQLYGPLNEAIITNLIVACIIIIVGTLVVMVVSKRIFQPIESITHAVTALNQKDGDLTARLNISQNNEIGILASQVDTFIEKLQHMFLQVSHSAEHVKGIAVDVNRQIELTQSYSSTQSDSTQSVAAAVEEMNLTVKEISDSAQGASEVANTTQENVVRSSRIINDTMQNVAQLNTLMDRSVDSVNALSDSIDSITRILNVIRDISEQTNLLALNAAIEAARAGDQGRGFAVVADEVRNLARRTNESTEEIDSMITELNAKASQTVQDIQQGSSSTHSTSEYLSSCVQALDNISAEVSRLTQVNTHVASATREQSTATHEISSNIAVISQTAHETSHSMTETVRLVGELDEESKRLNATIGLFTLK